MDQNLFITAFSVLLILLLAVGVLLFLRSRAKTKNTKTGRQRVQKSTRLSKKQAVPKSGSVRSTSKAPAARSTAQSTQSTPSPQQVQVPSRQAPPPSPSPASSLPPNSQTTPAQVVTNLEQAPGIAQRPVEGKSIRILVVDDNRETSEHVTRLLYFEDDMEVIGQAVDGQNGIEMTVKKRPHIVLMDINMPDMDGITATARLRELAPYSQVIMISVQSDPEYMKQAMIAGARDFQPKPFSADELVNCIRRVYERAKSIYEQFETGSASIAQSTTPMANPLSQTERNGKAIALFSPKGGVGTSTLAANLAAAFSKSHEAVVLVDADFQFGDILVHLNTHDTRSIVDLFQSGQYEAELLPQVLVPHATGLRLLLAPHRPEMAELVTSQILGQVLEDLKTSSDVVIVDTGSLLSDQMLTILEHVDHVLVITTPILPAVKNVKLFLDLAHALDFDVKRMSLLVNRVGLPASIPTKQIENALKLPRTFEVPDDFALHTAINSGNVLVQQKPNSLVAQTIIQISQQLEAVWAQKENEPVVEGA